MVFSFFIMQNNIIYYENKDSIIVEELENSYFANNLKSIVVCIKALQESGLITCHFTASLDEELTCDMVFEIIKNIKFNSFPKEEIEEFVKRI